MKFNKLALAALFATTAVVATGCVSNEMTNANTEDKVIIAHRGASGYLPEHTLESKALAYMMGVKFVEQDIAMTRDNHVVVVHDHYLDRVTDVAEKFPKRARRDGRYYVIDFTLDEIRQLNFTEGFEIVDGKKIQGYKDRFPMFKSRFKIHTLEEEIEFVQGLNKTLGKDIGIYVETKAPWFHKQEGKDISKATLQILKKYGYTTKDSNVIFQTFDYPDLVYVKTKLMPEMGMDLKTVMLLARTSWNETFELVDGQWQPYNFDYLLDTNNFKEIAKYADGLGPTYEMLFDLDKTTEHNIVINDFVQKAHENGMIVHPYTIRKDKLPKYVTDVNELYKAVLIDADADGVFTDFPDLGVQFLETYKK